MKPLHRFNNAATQTTLAKFLAFMTLALFASNAYAHAEEGVAGGLISGFLHPIYGFDHLLAMVAVGLWGAQLGKPAIYVLPITFPLVMAVGGLVGMSGIYLPFVELGISASALALGGAVALCLRPPIWAAAILVGLFAIYHGHAHGTELPGAVNPLAYGVGFVISTGLMHLVGILLGGLTRWPKGHQFIRSLGGIIAAAGVVFVVNSLGLLT
jgi:urease accessory protein